MKKLLCFLLLCFLVFWLPLTCLAPFEWDVSKGIDLTAQNSVTAAQLNQLVDGATIYVGKGLVIRQAVHPNVTDNPRYTNYLFLDISGGFPGILKQYQGTGDSGTNWVAATIGVAQITASLLAPNAVTAGAIAANAIFSTNINNNAILNQHIAALQIAGNQLQNQTVTRDKIALGAVDSTILTNGAVITTNLADGSVTGAKIANGTITSANMGNYAATNIGTNVVGNAQLQNAAITTNNIATTGASALQMLQVDATGGFVGWATPTIRSNVALTVSSNANGAITVAHGLGARPTLIRLVLTNAITDHGWAVGDEVEMNTWNNSADSVSVASDASSVFVIYNNLPALNPKGGGGPTAITAGRWGWKVYVFR